LIMRWKITLFSIPTFWTFYCPLFSHWLHTWLAARTKLQLGYHL
jgi:hypothetical protein